MQRRFGPDRFLVQLSTLRRPSAPARRGGCPVLWRVVVGTLRSRLLDSLDSLLLRVWQNPLSTGCASAGGRRQRHHSRDPSSCCRHLTTRAGPRVPSSSLTPQAALVAADPAWSSWETVKWRRTAGGSPRWPIRTSSCAVSLSARAGGMPNCQRAAACTN